MVHSVHLKDGDSQAQTENAQWLSKSALQGAAVSTGVKKVFILFFQCVCVCVCVCVKPCCVTEVSCTCRSGLDYHSQKADFSIASVVNYSEFSMCYITGLH